MLGLLFVLVTGSAVAWLILALIPRWQRWSVFAVAPFVAAVGAAVCAAGFGSISDSFLGFFCGYVAGGLAGAALGSWLAYTFWRLLRQPST